MKLTKEWLVEKRACSEGVGWWEASGITDGVAVVQALISEDKLDWANWLIVHLMDYRQCTQYAVYTGVIDIYEKEYPNDSTGGTADCAGTGGTAGTDGTGDTGNFLILFTRVVYTRSRRFYRNSRSLNKIIQYGLTLLKEEK